MKKAIIFILLFVSLFGMVGSVSAAPNCDKYQCITCKANINNVGVLTYDVKTDGKENITVTHELKQSNENSTISYAVNYDSEYFYSKEKNKLVCPTLGYLTYPTVSASGRVTNIIVNVDLRKPSSEDGVRKFNITTASDNKKPYKDSTSNALKCQYTARLFTNGRGSGSTKLTIVSDKKALKYNFGSYKVGLTNEADISMFQTNACPQLAINCATESKTCDIYKELNDPVSNAQDNKPVEGEDPINADDLAKDNEFCRQYDCMPSGSIDPSLSAIFSAAEDTCELIKQGTATYTFLKKVINYVKIGTVFLVLVLGMVDLAGAVGSEEENAFKKAASKFGKRLIAAALVFLVPVIVEILISLVNDASCKDVNTLKDIYN